MGRSLPSWPTGRPLRAWQQAAAAAVFDHDGDAFLASATPAAGKTTFGLHVAHRMLSEGRVARVAVVAPTTHICRQWALDAARYGIQLEPNRPNSAGPEPRDRHGVAVTYATVAAGPEVHRRRCAERPTLLIADEPHHMGEDATWGRTTIEAFARARFRLLLSGTPFRSDNSPIPWVDYDEEGVSRADYGYGYTQALVDGVCRPVTFHTYGGDMEWVSDGRVRRADFDVVLPAAGGRAAAAHGAGPGRRLDHPRPARRRRGAARRCAPASTPRRAGWSSRSTRSTPRSSPTGWRGSPASGRTSCTPTPRTPRRGSPASRPGSAPWLVSVLMVSEGVDVPRLRVGVYATTARTELFFRQVIGRFIRRTPAPKDQMSHVFLPSDPRLKQLAVEIEEERNHALVLEPAGEPVAERGERAEAGEAVPGAVVERPPRRRRAADDPARRRAAALRRAGAAGRLARAGGVHDDAARRGRRRRAGDGVRAARAPARRAHALVGHDRPPHRRGAPRRSTRASTARSARRRSTSRPTSSSSGRTACSSGGRRRRG